MHIDFAGTSPQVDRGINCVMNYTHAYSVYPVKCALDPFTPRNEGSYQAITVTAPERSILNPRFPAPCQRAAAHGAPAGGRDLQGAVAGDAGQDHRRMRRRADHARAVQRHDARWRPLLAGAVRQRAAWAPRPHRDGLPTTAFPTNVGAGSIEAYESVAPLMVWKKQLRPDSGGAGTFRGGLGQEVEIEVRAPDAVRLSLLSDRRDHPASGVLGGGTVAPR
jgi:N-methylhydantoinase B